MGEMEYHEIRVNENLTFIDWGLRVIDISHKFGIKGIIGRARNDPQKRRRMKAYLFDQSRWTEDSARKLLEEHSIVW